MTELLLPRRCPACQRARFLGLCDDCTGAAGELVPDEVAYVALASGVAAVAAFQYADPIAQAVRTVKRPGRHGAAPALGKLMWSVVTGHLPLTGLPVTWVPAAPAAMRARGVDIPRLLAGDGAQPLLRSTGDRADQTSVTGARRHDNVAGAFTATTKVPSTVVCVDDVRTTGATLTAASTALRAAGAQRVICVTLAVAGNDWR